MIFENYIRVLVRMPIPQLSILNSQLNNYGFTRI